jgi:hypothetical protein
MAKTPARRKRRRGEVETVRPKSPARTIGEAMFERYLNESGLPFRYQPPHIGVRKNPDYLVDTPRGKSSSRSATLSLGNWRNPLPRSSPIYAAPWLEWSVPTLR